jgi:hypothetical protein
MLLDIRAHGLGRSGPQAVLFSGSHLQKLPSAGDKGGKDFLIRRRSWPNFRLDSFSKKS